MSRIERLLTLGLGERRASGGPAHQGRPGRRRSRPRRRGRRRLLRARTSSCAARVTGEGLDAVRALIGPHGTVGLVGASGHGKSSLTNALVGAEVLSTKDIRADGKGRHTSVRRELVPLPGGGAIIDTPGLRGVGLQSAEQGLAATFPDVEASAEQCRFRDCSHQQEPGCAVRAAVEDWRRCPHAGSTAGSGCNASSPGWRRAPMRGCAASRSRSGRRSPSRTGDGTSRDGARGTGGCDVPP